MEYAWDPEIFIHFIDQLYLTCIKSLWLKITCRQEHWHASRSLQFCNTKSNKKNLLGKRGVINRRKNSVVRSIITPPVHVCVVIFWLPSQLLFANNIWILLSSTLYLQRSLNIWPKFVIAVQIHKFRRQDHSAAALKIIALSTLLSDGVCNFKMLHLPFNKCKFAKRSFAQKGTIAPWRNMDV